MTKRRKEYVEVEVIHRMSGAATPKKITFVWGESFRIDKILQVRRAASEVGSMGIRYTCMIGTSQAYLFDEENGRWFVELKVGNSPA